VSRVRAGAPAGIAIGLSSGALAGALGGVVYLVLKDVAGLTSEYVLEGASLAVVGALLGGRFASLSTDEDAAAYRSVGLGGGLVAGVIAHLAYDGHVATWLVAAIQSTLLVGALAALLVAPALTQPSSAGRALEL
jgi:hypothetical protein